MSTILPSGVISSNLLLKVSYHIFNLIAYFRSVLVRLKEKEIRTDLWVAWGGRSLDTSPLSDTIGFSEEIFPASPSIKWKEHQYWERSQKGKSVFLLQYFPFYKQTTSVRQFNNSLQHIIFFKKKNQTQKSYKLTHKIPF